MIKIEDIVQCHFDYKREILGVVQRGLKKISFYQIKDKLFKDQKSYLDIDMNKTLFYPLESLRWNPHNNPMSHKNISQYNTQEHRYLMEWIYQKLYYINISLDIGKLTIYDT